MLKRCRLGRKALVVIGGPAANIAFAVLLLTGVVVGTVTASTMPTVRPRC